MWNRKKSNTDYLTYYIHPFIKNNHDELKILEAHTKMSMSSQLRLLKQTLVA